MLKIINDQDPRLRARSLPVNIPLTDEEISLAHAMLDYLKASQDEEFATKNGLQSGVGLAAPQVGVLKRIIALYYLQDSESDRHVEMMLANPRIVSSSVRECYIASGEGCLSVPEAHAGRVYRPWKITLEAYDIAAQKPLKLVLRGYDAVVVQHEIDHLNGVLYYDHIDPQRALEDDPAVVII